MENIFITNDNIHKDVLYSLIKQKEFFLSKIYRILFDSNRICCNICEEETYIKDIFQSIQVYNSLYNLESKNEIITVLKDVNYKLNYSTIEFIKKNMSSVIIDEMNHIHYKINSFLENKLIEKINNIQNNQDLLINNQKIIMESLNQINGNNYDIQIINYLSQLKLESNNYSRMINFYEQLVKKMNAYNLSATVLSSGEINVNDSMIHATTHIAQAGINIIEKIGGTIPFGEAITSIATAGGIHYLNKQQLSDNQNYYDLLNSVTHTEGVSKLSSLKIIKQIDIDNINKINNKYAEYFVKKWRKTQIELIKEKKIPLYNLNNHIQNIEQFVNNITLYHNQLCDIILKEFIIIVNNDDYIDKCINCLRCTKLDNILYNNIEYKSDNRIIDFFNTKKYFTHWKSLIINNQ